MKKSMSLRSLMGMALLFMTLRGAEQPQNLAQIIEDLANQAQNWILIIQANFDDTTDKLSRDFANTVGWKNIEIEWAALKDQLNDVSGMAVQLFTMEDVPPTQRDKHLHTLLNDMKNLMPSKADLTVFNRRIDEIRQQALETKLAQPMTIPVAKPEAQQTQMPTTEIPVATFDVPDIAPQNINLRLPQLDDKLIEAGVNEPDVYYNIRAINTLETRYGGFRALHCVGNYVIEDFLANYFFNSLFQFYTTQLLGYNPNWSEDFFAKLLIDVEAENPQYTGYLLPFAKKLTNTPNFSFENPRHHNKFNFYDPYNLRPYILRAIEKFKQNKLLRELGIAYQRQKIVLEKLKQIMQEQNGNILKLVLKQDLFLTDLQTLIYNFMDDAYDNLKNHLRKINNLNEQQLNEFDNFLKDYKPQFLKHYPYYIKIIDNLAKFQQPSRGYFEWAGKIYKID